MLVTGVDRDARVRPAVGVAGFRRRRGRRLTTTDELRVLARHRPKNLLVHKTAASSPESELARALHHMGLRKVRYQGAGLRHCVQTSASIHVPSAVMPGNTVPVLVFSWSKARLTPTETGAS